MKKIHLIILLLLPALVWAQNKQELTSKIERVTVYYDGAQVTRVAKAQLQSGTTELTLKGITKFADVGNLQVKGEGNFTILKVSPVPNYMREKESKEDITKLEKRNKEIDEKLKDLYVDRGVYQVERSLITSNQNLKGNDAVLTMVQLKDMADFFRVRIGEIDGKTLAIDREVQKLNDERTKNVSQLAALANFKNDMTYDVMVTVSAKTATAATVSLSYNTAKAGWFASYDVVVNNVNEPLNLNLRANVSQTSGEDWKDVKLTLSTGSPSINNNKPELKPWYLNFNVAAYKPSKGYNPNPTLTEAAGRLYDTSNGEPIIGATVMVKGTGIGTVTDINGNFKLTLPPNSDILVIKSIGYNNVETWPTGTMNVGMQQNAQELDAIVVTESNSRRTTSSSIQNAPGVAITKGKRYDDKGADYGYLAGNNATTTVVAQPTTYVFVIDEEYTITSNGKPNTVGIKDYELPAYYEYYCAPKLDKDAFLTAQITGWEKYELIDGEANVYFENTYIGRSLIDLTNTDDTLQVSLGRDKNVVVDLVKTKEFTQRQVLGSNRIDKRAWEITVKNKKKQEINLVLQDRFPIPQNNEITVDNIDVAGSDFNKDTGILTWRIKLAANEEKKVAPKYSVKYPKGRVIYLE
ncbi:MAG: mucoidy inhibitor MuiA family protein [Sphingobacteriales bacterium JAD_PAG50586_3]|nr:MAG: mucoidy inhibitor MuiA family protein [Sphingobacteriales bacterium JAD_PAG50586_3]